MKQNEIPEAIQEILWITAESGDPNAAAEFERRYPQYKAELVRVQAMIGAMRRARPVANTQTRFERPVHRNAPIPSRLALVAAVLFGLALVGYSAYQITGLVVNRNHESEPSVDVHQTQTPPASGQSSSSQPSAPASPNPGSRGVAERPVPPTQQKPMVTLRGDASLFDAINAFKAAGLTVHVDPDVRNMPLGLAPDNPDAVLTVPPEEAMLLLEKLAPVRVQDLGPDGYLVVPLDKVSNVETPGSRPTMPNRNESGPRSGNF